MYIYFENAKNIKIMAINMTNIFINHLHCVDIEPKLVLTGVMGVMAEASF